MGERSRVFEVETATEVAVLNPDGRVRRQKTPEGVAVVAFRHILAAVDLFWSDKGVFPTPQEAQELIPSVPLSTFKTVYATDEFRQALEHRGIPVEEGFGLTEKQMVALQLLTNPGDGRSTTAKLRDIGVAYSTFQNWLRQPLFSRLYRERTERMLENIVPAAISTIAANVEAGSQRSAEFVLKMTGRYDPDAVEVQNARTVVLTLVESIQRHVQDPAVRKAILGDLDDTMTKLTAVRALKES